MGRRCDFGPVRSTTPGRTSQRLIQPGVPGGRLREARGSVRGGADESGQRPWRDGVPARPLSPRAQQHSHTPRRSPWPGRLDGGSVSVYRLASPPQQARARAHTHTRTHDLRLFFFLSIFSLSPSLPPSLPPSTHQVVKVLALDEPDDQRRLAGPHVAQEDQLGLSEAGFGHGVGEERGAFVGEEV